MATTTFDKLRRGFSHAIIFKPLLFTRITFRRRTHYAGMPRNICRHIVISDCEVYKISCSCSTGSPVSSLRSHCYLPDFWRAQRRHMIRCHPREPRLCMAHHIRLFALSTMSEQIRLRWACRAKSSGRGEPLADVLSEPAAQFQWCSKSWFSYFNTDDDVIF